MSRLINRVSNQCQNSVVSDIHCLQVQRSRQLMSPSPVASVESKMLPINFQMVTQPLKPSPKTLQNILSSPVGERSARQRYAQILPKPSATAAIALRSPSTMIIANNPIKTVVTTCHVSPVSLVKMTAISLAPSSSNAGASLTNTTLRPASAGVSTPSVTEDSSQSLRSASAVPILAPVARLEPAPITHGVDVEMEVEAIHKNSQMQNLSGLIANQGGMANKTVGAVQRAASVPIPQTKGFLGLEKTLTECYGRFSSSTNTVAAVEGYNACSNNTSSLHSAPSGASLLNTSRPPSFGESNGAAAAKEGFSSTKSFRKRSGLSPDLSPVKRLFVPQQPVGGDAGLGYAVANSDAPARPESAPASREVEMKMSGGVHALCTSSFRASGFCSVAKTQGAAQMKNGCHASTQQQHQQGYTVPNMHVMPNNSSLQRPSSVSDASGLNAASLEGTQQHPYPQSHPATEALAFLNQASQLPMQVDMDYFPFDDDVTQDSIVEELVQMEEQMNLNLQGFGDCVPLQGQHAAVPINMMSPSQTMTALYHAANNNSGSMNLIQTPTPTPTSDMLGGAHGLTGESPCSRIASTTPVDSALGSSRHTPVGTPLSNCSSTVPPSPVECRNPFAFTPINSSVTSFHDSGTVSCSPVKPMQRPTATHPDKTRLEWMNNSYNSSSGTLKAGAGMGILPSYQGLIDDHFQKPHAFAVPHARHHDAFGRLTPISPVQQQVANMASMSRQEGFAVPAPLDSKGANAPAASFRCRSVSPAVHQRNSSGGALANVPRSAVSPFNLPVMPEVLNIFANSQMNLGASSMAQRSRSVPLNIMMQTEVPPPGQQCNSSRIAGVVLRKLDGDRDEAVRGLGINNVPSSYTARMNLSHIPESDPNQSCADTHLTLMSPDSSSTCTFPRPNFLPENAIREQVMLQAACGEHRQAQSMFMTLNPPQQQQEAQQPRHLGFNGLMSDSSLPSGSQLVEQASELTPCGTDFPCEIRMTTELSSSINDLNALDANLLFDPNQQQGQHQNAAAAEELANGSLFQQMTSEATHSGGLDWLDSKDHPAVGLMG